jgi:hypothetical protein
LSKPDVVDRDLGDAAAAEARAEVEPQIRLV